MTQLGKRTVGPRHGCSIVASVAAAFIFGAPDVAASEMPAASALSTAFQAAAPGRVPELQDMQRGPEAFYYPGTSGGLQTMGSAASSFPSSLPLSLPERGSSSLSDLDLASLAAWESQLRQQQQQQQQQQQLSEKAPFQAGASFPVGATPIPSNTVASLPSTSALAEANLHMPAEQQQLHELGTLRTSRQQSDLTQQKVADAMKGLAMEDYQRRSEQAFEENLAAREEQTARMAAARAAQARALAAELGRRSALAEAALAQARSAAAGLPTAGLPSTGWNTMSFGSLGEPLEDRLGSKADDDDEDDEDDEDEVRRKPHSSSKRKQNKKKSHSSATTSESDIHEGHRRGSGHKVHKAKGKAKAEESQPDDSTPDESGTDGDSSATKHKHKHKAREQTIFSKEDSEITGDSDAGKTEGKPQEADSADDEVEGEKKSSKHGDLAKKPLPLQQKNRHNKAEAKANAKAKAKRAGDEEEAEEGSGSSGSGSSSSSSSAASEDGKPSTASSDGNADEETPTKAKTSHAKHPTHSKNDHKKGSKKANAEESTSDDSKASKSDDQPKTGISDNKSVDSETADTGSGVKKEDSSKMARQRPGKAPRKPKAAATTHDQPEGDDSKHEDADATLKQSAQASSVSSGKKTGTLVTGTEEEKQEENSIDEETDLSEEAGGAADEEDDGESESMGAAAEDATSLEEADEMRKEDAEAALQLGARANSYSSSSSSAAATPSSSSSSSGSSLFELSAKLVPSSDDDDDDVVGEGSDLGENGGASFGQASQKNLVAAHSNSHAIEAESKIEAAEARMAADQAELEKQEALLRPKSLLRREPLEGRAADDSPTDLKPQP
eukprot:CAMPEP_0206421916 /NCGR_PEP_ID=MMETSP0324_2-20121206/1739_1 /ASSEMBLY_ACC=CAM_ASM_000836 /TAXON_ID=2866 /ORGANISM="Crypthecodinium cohnii, Strain Seligo" /LENGTH=840 /DNA_ID=CAMNT_0053886115 /DNA_START=92 /DNA_END=2614 /DNA_ORIENTATION=+